jgi:dihydropyrimidinase
VVAVDAVFRGGDVVTEGGVRRADLLVRGQTIHSIGPNLSCPGAREIDAAGMYVLPGGVDVHTHIGMAADGRASKDDWFRGTAAAACGGTTTIVEHPAFGPKGCPLFHQIRAYRDLAGGVSAVDYSFHGVVQHVDDEVQEGLGELARAGVTSVKVYLTYDFRLEDGDVLAVLERMRETGGLTAVHCENHGIVTHLRERFRREGKIEPWFHPLSRPAEAEAEAVSRMARLSEVAGGAPLYIVHLSSAAGLEEVRRARARGVPVFAETCPQYLLLDDEAYREPDLGGLKYMMSPPLRTERDREALWQGLSDGAIQCAATDHCAFSFGMKKERSGGSFLSCPNGAPGVETRLPLLFSEGVAGKRIGVVRLAEITATAPARLMGLYPRKGLLAPGSDADIVLVDPGRSVRLTATSLHQNTDYTPFEGFELSGYPALTMLRGRVIFSDGAFVGAGGDGELLHRGRPVLPPL